MSEKVRPKRAASKAPTAQSEPFDFSFGAASASEPSASLAATIAIGEEVARLSRAYVDLDDLDESVALSDRAQRGDPHARAVELSGYFARLAVDIRQPRGAHAPALEMLSKVWSLHRPSSPKARRLAFMLWVEWLAERATDWTREGYGEWSGAILPPELAGDAELTALVRAWQASAPGAKKSASGERGKWILLAAHFNKDSALREAGEKVTPKRMKDDWIAHKNSR